MLHQVITHRAGAVLRQGLIHLIAAHIVGVAADFDVESRVGEQNAGDFRQLLPRTRLQRVFSGVKQNIGHADDEAARAVASLKDLVQLLGQSRAHGALSASACCALDWACCAARRDWSASAWAAESALADDSLAIRHIGFGLVGVRLGSGGIGLALVRLCLACARGVSDSARVLARSARAWSD